MTETRKQEYLGDGVYASWDGWHVWLKLNEWDRGIALEPAVLDRLNAFSAACRQSPLPVEGASHGE